MRKTLFGLTATAAVLAATLIGGAANASVTDTFIGKGDVQTAFNLNNAKMQSAVGTDGKGVTFTSSQPATQSLTSSASQVVTETATQSAHRVLSCTVTVGGVKNPRVFEADGSRDGVKTGSRTGSRIGSRAGSLDGVLNASIDTTARKTGQWTGWNINGFLSGPAFSATGVESFEAPAYGNASFSGDYAFGNVEWSGWQAEPGTNPADCLRNDNGALIEDLSDVTTYGDPVVTGSVLGAESFGPTVVTGTTTTGTAKVSATIAGVTKAIN